MFPVRVVAILRPVSEREAQRLRVYLAASCDAVLLSWKHDRPGPAGLGKTMFLASASLTGMLHPAVERRNFGLPPATGSILRDRPHTQATRQTLLDPFE